MIDETSYQHPYAYKAEEVMRGRSLVKQHLSAIFDNIEDLSALGLEAIEIDALLPDESRVAIPLDYWAHLEPITDTECLKAIRERRALVRRAKETGDDRELLFGMLRYPLDILDLSDEECIRVYKASQPLKLRPKSQLAQIRVLKYIEDEKEVTKVTCSPEVQNDEWACSVWRRPPNKTDVDQKAGNP